MSSNAEFDALLKELRGLRDPGERDTAPGLLVMRRVHDLSPEAWERFRQRHPNSRWGVVALDDSRLTRTLSAVLERSAADICPDACPPPQDGEQVLTRLLSFNLFHAQLERDLLRLHRNGGQLALICMALTEEARAREGSTEAIAHLAEQVTRLMESCDTLGALPDGGLALTLPGIGPLRARALANRLSEAYRAEDGQRHPCGFAVLGLAQPMEMRADDLLERIVPLLARACACPEAVASETLRPTGQPDTLVQSREKRFLFFGGE